MSDKPLSVWLIEDHANYRDIVASILRSHKEIRSLLDFPDAESALKRLTEIPARPPDIILLDLGLPNLSGLDAIPKLKQKAPECDIVVLTVFDDKLKEGNWKQSSRSSLLS